MKIPFMKMSGSGNDFILVDHRNRILAEDQMKGFARRVCQRRVSVGADGLILIEGSEKADFKWRFFNADGSEAEMCGNGGRCAARFAYLKGIAGASLTFETMAGILSAQVDGKRVKLQMTKPYGLKLDEAIFIEDKEQILSSINTGVPHAVIFLENLERTDVVRLGLVKSPVSIKTWGEEILTVHFEIEGKEVKRVFFEGEVHMIYEAEMWEEAYNERGDQSDCRWSGRKDGGTHDSHHPRISVD